eukprot:6364812-Amphidinium_carterae.1
MQQKHYKTSGFRSFEGLGTLWGGGLEWTGETQAPKGHNLKASEEEITFFQTPTTNDSKLQLF